jgi:thiamine-monophosphate kinase
MALEFDFISWVRNRLVTPPDVLVGPGDDCAEIAPNPAPLLITTDTITEGVDFLLSNASARQIGYKAMAVNLSDIAAMAGVPRYALISIVTRSELGPSFLHELFEGVQSLAEQFEVAIVGGDTNSWNGGLVVSVTLIGTATSRGAVKRSGAKLGDWIFVTGPCGGSILGRHLRPVPQIREALAIHELCDIHAMIDISDGLAADLQHILEESQLGAELHDFWIPIHPDARTLAATTGRTPLDHALNDGEDFELVFTVSPEDGAKLSTRSGLTRIGTIIEQGYQLVSATGDRTPLIPKGWQHQV